MTPQWRHNERDGVSNQQPHDCLFNCFSDADKQKHRSSASLAFERGIHRWPVNSLHKGPVTRKTFPFGDVIMNRIKLEKLYDPLFETFDIKRHGAIRKTVQSKSVPFQYQIPLKHLLNWWSWHAIPNVSHAEAFRETLWNWYFLADSYSEASCGFYNICTHNSDSHFIW